MVDGISGLSSTGAIPLPPVVVDAPDFELPTIEVTPDDSPLDDPLPGGGSFGDPIAGFQATNAQMSAAVNALSQQIDATGEQMRLQSEATLAQVASTGASLSAQLSAANVPPAIAPPPPEVAPPPLPSQPASTSPAPASPPAPSTAPSAQVTSEISARGDQVAETLADAAKTAAAGAIGYRAGMYGEVGVGPFTADIAKEQQFGRFSPGSTLADQSYRGFGIDHLAQRGGLAQQTLVSTQAAFDYARQQAAVHGLQPGNVPFEVGNRLSPGRTYDLQFEVDTPLGPKERATEIKAGKSIDSRQLTKDIAAAGRDLDVDYRFADNPLTGNHGPGAATAARLNAATAATNGKLTWGITDVAPSQGAIATVETAARVSHAARAVGRVAAPVGLAADAFSIGSGIAADGGTFGRNATVATAGAAGGWAGAVAGGWSGVQLGTLAGGALGGPVGAPIGAVVGGIVGAIGGGLFGGWGAERAARAATN